ncbi:hypothetical protein [Rickettsia sp. Tenjiku01]|uniref:hypothetical protein n=1 Tax=Rickettsia sp. Tenjiku01 TaxID=1736693 RepID=UPI000ADA6A74|nr:hypothetical protein [Rickettsia sp. Tenjiku01]
MEDIRFYENLPSRFDYFVQSWDTAINCNIWGILEQKYYLVSLVRQKLIILSLRI